MATHSSTLLVGCSPWGRKGLDTTEDFTSLYYDKFCKLFIFPLTQTSVKYTYFMDYIEH